jgi:hypothetical protein
VAIEYKTDTIDHFHVIRCSLFLVSVFPTFKTDKMFNHRLSQRYAIELRSVSVRSVLVINKNRKMTHFLYRGFTDWRL